MDKKIIVTGCAGFIGGHFTESALTKGFKVIGIDKLSYASDLAFLETLKTKPNFSFINKDICELDTLFNADIVFNFAAESHVTNSINDSRLFIQSNINGVRNILDLIKLNSSKKIKLIHISTDEVYGDRIDGSFDELSLLNPSNPYSASKAGADLLINSYVRTFGLDVAIVRPTNNYGKRQHIEKLIPLTIEKFKNNIKVPLHQKGEPIRTWLHVEDTCDAVFQINQKNLTGIFNINGPEEYKNIDTVKYIYEIVKEKFNLGSFNNLLDLSHIRPGQDERYSVDDTKIKAKTEWVPKRNFYKNLEEVVKSFC